MQSMNWKGVLPAITTPFSESGAVDLLFLQRHTRWLIDQGCDGIVALGSLGEGGSLTFVEKLEVLEACVEASNGKPVVAGVAALSTQEAVEIARAAERIGCTGLMVLPPYVYPGDHREITNHMAAVFRSTQLSCMLYNNPIAYRIDFNPKWVSEFCNHHPNLHSIKESSADVRRIREIKFLLGSRLEILVGVDDLIVEGIEAGATGWIAGLVNAFPKESIQLFQHCLKGEKAEAERLYEWFLPLLRLDVVPKFVQLIKLTQAEVGMGSAKVRAPRLELEGSELRETVNLIRGSLANRP